eukprot:m.340872 g.340872  ORF g.340872 m.340872 type:complete len:451 (+) comp19610_c0_seq1:273-1625(+)
MPWGSPDSDKPKRLTEADFPDLEDKGGNEGITDEVKEKARELISSGNEVLDDLIKRDYTEEVEKEELEKKLDELLQGIGRVRRAVRRRRVSHSTVVSSMSSKKLRDKWKDPRKSFQKPPLHQLLWRHPVYRAIILLFVVIIFGTIFGHFRIGWPSSFAFYWAVVTALTVGYGDLPYCGSLPGNPCTHSEILDSNGNIVFVIVYAIITVSIVTFLLTELLNWMSQRERARISKAKRALLESYISGGNARASFEKMEPNDFFLVRSRAGICSLATLRAMLTHWKFRMGVMLTLSVVTGLVFFKYQYDTSFLEALYWVVISGLAVGFGDTHPTDDAGYIFGAFLITALVCFTYSVIGFNVRREISISSILSESFSSELLAVLDRDGDGEVSEAEYLGSVLVMLDKTDFSTVDLILRHFQSMDKNDDQVLDLRDIELARNRHEPVSIFEKEVNY